MVEEYFSNPALSQSKLKLLLSDPKLFNTVTEPELYFEEKEHFIIGSAVDCKLTQPLAEFDKEYYVSELENKPSDAMKSIINKVFDEVVEDEVPGFCSKVEDIGVITTASYKAKILASCEVHDYQSNWKEDTKWSKVCEHWQYWEELKKCHGKTVLTTKNVELITLLEMSLKTSLITGKYFNVEEGEEIIFQLPVYFRYAEEDCRGLLDMVKINHKLKTIHPIDIKTMGDYTINFPKALRKRRYDIQAAFYTRALETWKEENGYSDYTIKLFTFLVDSTIDPGTPLVFHCTNTLLQIGEFGRPGFILEAEINDGMDYSLRAPYGRIEEILGFSQLIDLYKYHVEFGFDSYKIVKETGGELNMDWSGYY